jgi:hypothetical protein
MEECHLVYTTMRTKSPPCLSGTTVTGSQKQYSIDIALAMGVCCSCCINFPQEAHLQAAQGILPLCEASFLSQPLFYIVGEQVFYEKTRHFQTLSEGD